MNHFWTRCLTCLVIACSSEAGDGDSGIDSTASTRTGSGTSGGAGGEAGESGLALVGEPSFTSNDAAPLAGTFALSTNLPCVGTLQVRGAGDEWLLPLEPAATNHQTVVLGLAPDREYEFTARVDDGEEQLVTQPLSWHTPPLPDDFPDLELVLSDPARMQAGMTLFDLRLRQYLVVIDAEGVVRWYYQASEITTGHHLLENGHLLFMSGNEELIELDWLGNVTARWHAAGAPDFVPAEGSIPVEVDTVHHTVFEMPNGNILTLGEELRSIDDYPTSTIDPSAATTTAEVLGDTIIEFSRQGELVKEIHLLDILDPRRVGHDSVGAPVEHWSHCNAVAYDASSDAYLVSCRHQDAVFKIDRETESLVWILGDHANWTAPFVDYLLTPMGDDFEWAYHHHAVEVVPEGVGLFDNGNYRAPAFEEQQEDVFSRAVRYAIDEASMTATQTFSHWPTTEEGRVYANAMGDADWQAETGNTLIVSGTLQTDDDPPRVWGQLLEVNADGEVVFELHISADPNAEHPSTSTFEADRIPDIRFIESP